MRARFHAEPIIQATELLLQERAPRDVAVARPRVEEVPGAGPCPRLRGAGLPSVHVSPRPGSRGPICSPTGDTSVMLTAAGSGYSRCARPGDHPMARGRHARPLGDVHLPAGRQQRRGVVGRVPAHRRRAGHLPRDVLRGARRVSSARRRHHDHARSARLARRRRRDSPRLGHEPRRAGSRDRADVLRRARAGPAGGRRRAPGLFQPLRPDGVDRRPSTPCWPRAASDRPTSRAVWAAHIRRGRRRSPAEALQFETDRARFLGRGRGIRTPMSVIDGRPLSNTAGSVLDPIFSLRRRVRLGAGRERPPRLLHARRRPHATTPWRWPTSIATRRPSSARSRWPGRRRRCSCTISGSTRSEAHLFQEPRQPDPLLRPHAQALRRRAEAQHRRGPPPSGRTGSPATSRSSWSGSTSPRTEASSASSSALTSTGA